MNDIKDKKIALIGQGKTGSEIARMLEGCSLEVFDQERKPDAATLRGFDAAVVLVPGKALQELIPIFLESKVDVITGLPSETPLPSYLDFAVKQTRARWIVAANFSLGLTIIHEAIRILKHSDLLFPSVSFQVREVHNRDKSEGASQTSQQWMEWLNRECELKTERIGDVIGIHELILKTGDEEITLRHHTHHRRHYAHGAVWALRRLFSEPALTPGLHRFEELTRRELLSK